MACFVRCEVMVWAVEASGGGANQVVLRLQCERGGIVGGKVGLTHL